MKIVVILFAISFIAGCTSAPRDNSRDLARLFVGPWEWEEGPENCISLVNMAFKRNGTYTRTSESCELADDGFGIFSYGWYVANEHLCFVYIDEEFTDENPRKDFYKKIFREEKKKGFNVENCTWKIESASSKRITITKEYNSGESIAFTMMKRRWL